MNKAILIIDMPKNCYECPCFEFGMDNYCAVTGFTNYDYENGRAANCPLKSIPERKKLSSLYECGYNSCIGEILK